ncbi:ABC transporter ATP-binding protein [Halopiger aswanensis]|uniref:Peptide/nickel transport system ATP-binding protein n=1 Tax=Halopiger aswanensis TaxID=148449 RepID=A0A3R7ECU8_9EURY|nr:ABC transporter ATP-binding protein [Halopiger aswanensis]RKD89257.1 peptide/nickel transport system ATP-binding protein [Halopiger aswanensis]
MTVSQSAADIDRPNEDVIMKLRDTSVAFGMNRGQSRVLNDVDFDVQRDEIVGVIGESGSGKSMFASAMLDAVPEPGVTTGEVTYYPEDGEPISVTDLSKEGLRQFRWEEVSMVFQGAMSSFNPVLKIRTHFVETLSAHDYNVERGLERAKELLEDLYLEPERMLDSYPHELSGGMKQRVLIALSLVLDPEMLVMDEPTAALDLLMQRSIISLLEDIKEKHDLTIVFITHDLPLVADLADRLAVLYAFEFAEVGPADEILADPAHPYTRALLNATPNLSAPLEEMRPIEGESPDPVNIPEGCSYHPRCPLADDECRAHDPDAYDAGTDHDVYCHHWEDSIENIDKAFAKSDSSDLVRRTAADRTAAEEPVVSLNDVEIEFGSENDGLLDFGDSDVVTAVDGVSLDIYENDVVVLVGESGCGKTTLGKTAVGLQQPTDGTIEYKGRDIWEGSGNSSTLADKEIRRALQIVHQDPGSSLNSHHRVRTILETPLKRWHSDLDGNDRRERILGMLEYVGISPPEDYIDRYPHQLSGGEKQRVALIRAMLINPDLILADEAVSALDVSLRVSMMDLMIELQDTFNTSFLAISHDLSNARYFAEKTGGRIGVMYLGELVEIGSPEQIIHNPQHPYTQALRWATPELDRAEDTDENPMRTIDVPDQTNMPSGCRYHTRCPKAREVCKTEKPEMIDCTDEDGVQHTACFRALENHEYWDSEPIADDPPTAEGTGNAD